MRDVKITIEFFEGDGQPTRVAMNTFNGKIDLDTDRPIFPSELAFLSTVMDAAMEGTKSRRSRERSGRD